MRPVDLPKLVMVHGSRLQYYDLPSSSSAAAHARPWLEQTDLFDTFEAISEGRVVAKSSKTYVDRGMDVAGGAATSLVVVVGRHPYLSLTALLTLFVVFALFLRRVAKAGGASPDGYGPILPTNAGSKLD